MYQSRPLKRPLEDDHDQESSNRENHLNQYFQNNPVLMNYIKDPKVQNVLTNMLQMEKRSQQFKQPRFYHHQRNQISAGFPNPNHQPITELEKKIIEPEESPEQAVLRALVDHCLNSISDDS